MFAKRDMVAVPILGFYACVVSWGSLSGGGPIVSQFGFEGFVRAAAAAVLAVGIAFHSRVAARLATAFAGAFGFFGVVSLAGQLYQRYVPDSAGMYILLNGVAVTVTLLSTIALLITFALLTVRRTHQ